MGKQCGGMTVLMGGWVVCQPLQENFTIYSTFQHEKKFEFLMERATELNLDEESGCLLQVYNFYTRTGQHCNGDCPGGGAVCL